MATKTCLGKEVAPGIISRYGVMNWQWEEEKAGRGGQHVLGTMNSCIYAHFLKLSQSTESAKRSACSCRQREKVVCEVFRGKDYGQNSIDPCSGYPPFYHGPAQYLMPLVLKLGRDQSRVDLIFFAVWHN